MSRKCSLIILRFYAFSRKCLSANSFSYKCTLWSIFGPCLCIKSCKPTFYAHLSRIWKLTQFTRFIRKVFATKILLSGKFSLFLTLAEASNILTMCRIGNVLCDSTQWGNILAWGDNKKARVLQPIGQRNHDPTLLITKDLSAKIALLSGSVCQPSTLGQGELLLKLTKCTKAVVIVSTLLCANK